MNPEVLRLLNYMAAFSQPEFRTLVARAIDQIANTAAVHALVAAGAFGDKHIPYPVAILAAQAVDYVEGRAVLPDWLKQLGFSGGSSGELVRV